MFGGSKKDHQVPLLRKFKVDDEDRQKAIDEIKETCRQRSIDIGWNLSPPKKRRESSYDVLLHGMGEDFILDGLQDTNAVNLFIKQCEMESKLALRQVEFDPVKVRPEPTPDEPQAEQSQPLKRPVTSLMAPRLTDQSLKQLKSSTTKQNLNNMEQKLMKMMKGEVKNTLLLRKSVAAQPGIESLQDRIRYQLQQYLITKAKDIRANLEADPNFISVQCPLGHTLDIQKGKYDQSYIPKCSSCRQPHIDLHTFYFRCTHADCMNSERHKECNESIHEECLIEDYALCHMCALCDAGKLDLSIKLDFHKHVLHRHPINHRSQWSCHMNCKHMQEWIVSHCEVSDAASLQCKSKINGIAEKGHHQGYECLECDFDICLPCLMFLKEVPKEENATLDEEEESFVFSDSKLSSDCGKLDPKAKVQAQKEIEQLKAQAFEIHDCNSIEEDNQMIKGRQPHKIFASFQNQFIKKCLVDKISKDCIKIRGYSLHREKEIREMVRSDDFEVIESTFQQHPLYTQLFQIEKKDIQIIMKPNSQDFFLLVKVFESAVGDQDGRNIIKTLRICDPKNNFRVRRQILLEQIKAYTFNDHVRLNQISVIQNKFIIYFWRRLRDYENQGEFTMQLWKYDFDSDLLAKVHGYELKKVSSGKPELDYEAIQQLQRSGAKKIRKVEDRKNFSNGNGQWHLMFALPLDEARYETLSQSQIDWIKQGVRDSEQTLRQDEIAYLEQQAVESEEEKVFLNQQFVLKQFYMKEKSPQQKQRERIEAEFSMQMAPQMEYYQNQRMFPPEQSSIQEQQFYVSKLGSVNTNIMTQSNGGAQKPITQFFVRIKSSVGQKYSEEEQERRRDAGQDMGDIDYKDIQLIMMDEKQYQFNIAEPEIQSDPRVCIKYFDYGTFDDKMTDGSEIQKVPVKIIQLKDKFDQYFYVDSDRRIVHLHPLTKETTQEATKYVINEQVESLFWKDNDKEGKQVHIVSNIKSDFRKRKSIAFKNLNSGFLKMINERVKTFTENMLEYKEMDIENDSVKVTFFETPFQTLMIISKQNDGSAIQVFSCQSPAHTTFHVTTDKHVHSHHDKFSCNNNQMAMIKQLAKEPLSNQSPLFINSIYNGVFSRFNSINTCIEGHQVDYATPDFQSQASQRQKRTHSRQLERKDTNQQDWCEIGPHKPYLSLKESLQREQYVYIEGPAGRYMRIKVIASNPNDCLKLLTYYKSKLFYVFIFVYNNGCNFFVRKKKDEVEKLERNRQCLLHEKQEIHLLIEKDNIQMFPFSQLKFNSRLKNLKTIRIKLEGVVDVKEEVDFIPFLSVEVEDEQEEGRKEPHVQRISFCIYSINKQMVTSCIPINPSIEDCPDLLLNHIKLSKIQSMHQTHELLDKGRRYKRQQQCRYVASYYLLGECGRYRLREIDCTHFIEGTIKEGEESVYSQSKSTIAFLGLRRIISNRQEYYNFEFDSYTTIPYYNVQGKILGSQLLIRGKHRNGTKKAKQPVKTLTMLEGDFNTLYHYQSSILQYGFQKIYDIDNCDHNRSQNASFFTLVAVKFRDYIIEDKNLTNGEVQIVIKLATQMMLNIMPFNFLRQCLEDFDFQKKNHFFKTQEVFFGKSLVDAHLNEEKMLKHAFATEDYNSGNTMLDDALMGDDNMQELFTRKKLFTPTKIVNNDYNFYCQIERSFDINAVLSAKLMLNNILGKINSIIYQPVLLQILPQILEQQEHVDLILEFLSTSNEEMKDGSKEHCNFERYLQDHRLPLKTDKERENFEISNIQDSNFLPEDIVTTIQKRDRLNKEEKIIPVEHSYMDFQIMIITKKLKQSAEEIEEEGNFVFDAAYLSQLMLQESIDFYLQDAVQKIIDYQFDTTYAFFLKLVSIYILFFVVPLLLIIFRLEDETEVLVAFIICYFTQVFYFSIEIVQIRNAGWEYFKGWNINDFLQFFNFLTMMYSFLKWPEDKASIFNVGLSIVLVTQCFIKILFFLKIFSAYGFLVKMIYLSIIDMIPFLAFFFLWVIFFAVQFSVICMEYSSSDYPGLPAGIQMLILSFRNSIGDLQLPGYTKWTNIGSNGAYALISITWVLWLGNIFLMLIILLNFLIAVISSTYERVVSSQTEYTYKDKAEMNEECQTLLKIIQNQSQVSTVVFSFDKNLWRADGGASGMIDQIKKVIQTSNHEVVKKIGEVQDTIFGEIYTLKHQQAEVRQEMKEIKKLVSRQIEEQAAGRFGIDSEDIDELSLQVRFQLNHIVEKRVKEELAKIRVPAPDPPPRWRF